MWKKGKKRKKTKKCETKWKKRKNSLEFRFALFRLEAKNTRVKRSEKFEAKISEKKRKIEVKFHNERTKHMWNRSNFAYKLKNFLSETGAL